MIRAASLAIILGLAITSPSVAANSLASPLQGIITYANDDLSAAIALANGATPPDAVAAACFTSLQTGLKQIGTGALPISLKLATDAERLWLLRQSLLALKADVNCQAMCSRFGQLAPLLSKVVPTLCDGLNLVK
jgi:hypothetical protein